MRGVILVRYEALCGDCSVAAEGPHPSRRAAIDSAEAEGFSWTRQHGWLCPKCTVKHGCAGRTYPKPRGETS